MIRGVRGAVTADNNSETGIVDATENLLIAMIKENNISAEDVASIFISVTDDIDAVFPAKALRRIEGWTFVPVMCMREIPVPSALKSCIRIMIHVNTNIPQNKIKHVYLKGATELRPDLVVNE